MSLCGNDINYNVRWRKVYKHKCALLELKKPTKIIFHKDYRDISSKKLAYNKEWHQQKFVCVLIFLNFFSNNKSQQRIAKDVKKCMCAVALLTL